MKRSILALAIPLVLAAGGYRLITADAVAAGLAACGVTSGDGSAKMRSN